MARKKEPCDRFFSHWVECNIQCMSDFSDAEMFCIEENDGQVLREV